MSTGKRLTLETAQAIASGLMRRWLPWCRGLMVCGSIRRRQPTVGDIEIVARPIESGLWTEGLDDGLARMLAAGELERGEKQGPKYQQWLLPHHGGLKVDLFLATRENFGLIVALRTGPAAFSKKIVTQRHKGGRLRDGYRIEGGNLRRIDPDEVVALPDEREFLTKWCGAWVEPQNRR